MTKNNSKRKMIKDENVKRLIWLIVFDNDRI